jgi:hypothetical protein
MYKLAENSNSVQSVVGSAFGGNGHEADALVLSIRGLVPESGIPMPPGSMPAVEGSNLPPGKSERRPSP